MSRPDDTTDTDGTDEIDATGGIDATGEIAGTGDETTEATTAGPAAAGGEVARREANAGLGATVAALTGDDIEPAGRRQLLGRLVNDIRKTGLGQLFRPRAAIRWMADTIGQIAPHVQIRDRATLHRHFPDLSDDDLAERLVRNASRATAGVGAAGGGVASVEWLAAPALLSAPVLLAAETVAVVAVELKLIGELHEIYGQPVTGTTTHRAAALIQAWSQRRGVNPLVPGVGVAAVLGTTARKELQGTLLRRFGRNLTTLGPLLTGAAVASYLNRRATRSLGERVTKELRKRRPELPSA
jgi:uncharacterized protein (DUF697 family)